MCKEIFLDELPHKGKFVDWKNSVEYSVKGIYDDIEFEIEIIDYYRKNKKSYLKIKYNNNIYPISIVTLLKCKLGKILGMYTNEFKIEIGQTFKDDKRDLLIIDRKYKKDKTGIYRKWYKYKCHKCGFDGGEHYKNGEYQEEYWIEESHLLGKRKTGCAVCCPTPRIIVPGINDIPTTDPWIVKYFQGGYDEAKLYTKSSGQKIYPICPDCRRIKDKLIKINNIYTEKSIGCSCTDGQSYPNKFCHSLLEQLNMNFITEYSPEWIKPKRYDFYFELNEQKYIVEMDGNLGHGNIDNSMNGITKEDSRQIDDYKDKLAVEHNIIVIRIDSKISELEYIKDKILNSELNNIFNLSKVNWLKCEEFALSNLVKKACEYKRDNPDMTTTQIGKIMNISRTTIKKYLKKGTKIWDWISYDAKEEMRKHGKKYGGQLRKKVICLNNNKIFGSISEAENYYDINGGINLCCKDKRVTAGIELNTEEYLQWQLYDEYLINPKKILSNNEVAGGRPKKVICLNSNIVFNSIEEAKKYYNIGGDLCNCCKGEKTYAGIDLETNNFLQWQYYNEYLISPKKLLSNEEINNINKSSRRRLNTKKVFNSIIEASSYYNLKSHDGILKCCKGKRQSAGKDFITKEKLQWQYYEEYLVKPKNLLINEELNIKHNNKKVICLNNGKIFNSINKASKYYNVKSSNISDCCKEKKEYYGIDHATGEPLRWMYYEDYLKLNSNQLKTVNE